MKKLASIFLLFLFIAPLSQAQVRIKMKNENGVYTTPCIVNGLRLRFIFDTGASNVSISLSEALFMIKNGYLNENDLKGSSYSQIANGDLVSNTTVILRELEIGGIILTDVEAVIIHDLSAPLLLGQSAIQKLGKIQLEGDELLIVKSGSSNSANDCQMAKELIEKAEKYYFEELDNLSASTYQEAYNLCPDAFECFDYEIWGGVNHNIGNYVGAIKYLKLALNCTENIKSLYYINKDLGNSYLNLQDYSLAIVHFEKALSYTTENNDIASIYFYIALLKSDHKKFSEAVNYYEKSVSFRLKYLSVTMDDVLKGKVKDEIIGEALYNTYLNFIWDNQIPPKTFIAMSALCGCREAIMLCNELKIDYKSYVKK
jgi:clan AA aspartic protease (TIGR02281 family)